MGVTDYPSWLEARPSEWRIHLHVQPNAKKTEIMGVHGTALKLRLQAPPVDGKANQALTQWLAQQLKLTKADCQLISGELSREKTFSIARALIDADELQERLAKIR